MFTKLKATNGFCLSTENCYQTENCHKTANCQMALLTTILTILKLTGYITCSWLWVLAPLWLPVAIFVLVFLILLTLKIIHH